NGGDDQLAMLVRADHELRRHADRLVLAAQRQGGRRAGGDVPGAGTHERDVGDGERRSELAREYAARRALGGCVRDGPDVRSGPARGVLFVTHVRRGGDRRRVHDVGYGWWWRRRRRGRWWRRTRHLDRRRRAGHWTRR